MKHSDSVALSHKILLVDDEEAVLLVYSTMLGKLGYQVVTATNGYEGLAAYKREQPALVLTDLLMPHMDGLTFISALRVINQTIPIIVVSGGGNLKSALEAIRLGAWDYIEKPTPLEHLKLILKQSFERARLHPAQNSLSPADIDTGSERLSLLLIEDDETSREILCMRLEEHFSPVITAHDGTEGLRLFHEHRPDIVLTDQNMPGISGIELIRQIRSSGADTPVVLITGSIDEQTLLEAINAGVERFVPKPFDFDLLIRSLNGIAEDIVNERLLDRHRQYEVELLRYRDAYNSLQQESALRKERRVVKHDLSSRIIIGRNGARWGINVLYAPRDIMCGDGYSVRRLFDGRQLVFVVDAMGSGMSASLTAMMTTSFCNYQVENLHLWRTFSLRLFIRRFQEYLSGMLLDDEVVSCGFFLLDLKMETVESAVFALPPLLLRGLDGSVQRVRGNNPPLGVYQSEIESCTIPLAGIAELLIMSDGVTDAELIRGGAYREELESDFSKAPTLAALQRRFLRKTSRDDLDDLTLMHVRRLDFETGWKRHSTPELSLPGLNRAIISLLEEINLEIALESDERDELEIILTEATTNALEHGCLGISREEKARLQELGIYEEALTGRSFLPDAGIRLSAALWQGAAKPLLIMEVHDTGEGIPDDVMSIEAGIEAVNGRGLRMIQRYSDSLYIGDRPGGTIVMLKTLERGSNAD